MSSSEVTSIIIIGCFGILVLVRGIFGLRGSKWLINLFGGYRISRWSAFVSIVVGLIFLGLAAYAGIVSR